MVRGQLPGLREGQDAPARPGQHHSAPAEVQEVQPVISDIFYCAAIKGRHLPALLFCGGLATLAREGCSFMTVTTAMTAVAKAPSSLIEAFRSAPTSNISDNLAR